MQTVTYIAIILAVGVIIVGVLWMRGVFNRKPSNSPQMPVIIIPHNPSKNSSDSDDPPLPEPLTPDMDMPDSSIPKLIPCPTDITTKNVSFTEVAKKAKCVDLKKKYGIVAGVTFGTAPRSEQITWKDECCV